MAKPGPPTAPAGGAPDPGPRARSGGVCHEAWQTGVCAVPAPSPEPKKTAGAGGQAAAVARSWAACASWPKCTLSGGCVGKGLRFACLGPLSGTGARYLCRGGHLPVFRPATHPATDRTKQVSSGRAILTCARQSRRQSSGWTSRARARPKAPPPRHRTRLVCAWESVHHR